MLSTRLVHLLESHAEELTRELVHHLKEHPRTPAFRALPDREMHDHTYKVYKNLGAWLEGKSIEEIGRHYRELGARSFDEHVPLPQLVYALIMSKKHLLAHARHHGWSGTPVEIYSEQELVNRIDQFYDDALYYAALGFAEEAVAARV